MAFDSAAFITDVIKDVSLDDAQKQNLINLFNNPTIAKRLEESTLRQGDYSRVMTEYKGKIQKAQDYWDSLVDTDKRLRQERETLQRQLAGTDTSGLTNDGTHQQAEIVSKQELQKLAQEAIAYNNAVTKLAMQHYKEFGDILNLDDVVKVSSENGGININLAYDKYVSPKREEVTQQKTKEAVEQAREEGRQEAIKNFHIPTNESPMGVQNPALDALLQKPEERTGFGSMAAVKAWRDARSKGGVVNTVL